MRPISLLLFASFAACMEATVAPTASAAESPAVGFPENTGPIHGPAKFYALDPRGAAYSEPRRVRIDHAPSSPDGAGVVVDIDFPASRTSSPRLEALDPLPERVHRFTGTQPEWRTGLQAYREVRYRGIATGADLVYRV